MKKHPFANLFKNLSEIRELSDEELFVVNGGTEDSGGGFDGAAAGAESGLGGSSDTGDASGWDCTAAMGVLSMSAPNAQTAMTAQEACSLGGGAGGN